MNIAVFKLKAGEEFYLGAPVYLTQNDEVSYLEENNHHGLGPVGTACVGSELPVHPLVRANLAIYVRINEEFFWRLWRSLCVRSPLYSQRPKLEKDEDECSKRKL